MNEDFLFFDRVKIRLIRVFISYRFIPNLLTFVTVNIYGFRLHTRAHPGNRRRCIRSLPRTARVALVINRVTNISRLFSNRPRRPCVEIFNFFFLFFWTYRALGPAAGKVSRFEWRLTVGTRCAEFPVTVFSATRSKYRYVFRSKYVRARDVSRSTKRTVSATVHTTCLLSFKILRQRNRRRAQIEYLKTSDFGKISFPNDVVSISKITAIRAVKSPILF